MSSFRNCMSFYTFFNRIFWNPLKRRQSRRYCHEQEIDSQQCPYAARAEQKKSSSHSRNGNGRLSTVFYRCLEVRISTFPTHLTSLSGGGFAKLMPRAARAMFLLTKLAFAQWVTLKMHERVAKFRGQSFKV